MRNDMKLNKLFFTLSVGALSLIHACRSPESDEKLKSTIQAALENTPGIEVNVEEGNVTLDGQIGSDSLKQHIEDKTKMAGGENIKSIHNNIMILL